LTTSAPAIVLAAPSFHFTAISTSICPAQGIIAKFKIPHDGKLIKLRIAVDATPILESNARPATPDSSGLPGFGAYHM